jgi:hypothetical protein
LVRGKPAVTVVSHFACCGDAGRLRLRERNVSIEDQVGYQNDALPAYWIGSENLNIANCPSAFCVMRPAASLANAGGALEAG